MIRVMMDILMVMLVIDFVFKELAKQFFLWNQLYEDLIVFFIMFCLK